MRKLASLFVALALFAAPHSTALAALFTLPVAASFSTAVPVSAQSVIQLQGSDADGTPLVYAVLSGPSHGAISQLNTATGALVYTPTTNYTGSDSFTYKVTSGGEDSATATVTLTVTAAKTRIVDTLTNPDGTARQGKVTFFLNQVAASPSGIIPAKASVSAQLNSSGGFDVSLYPSRAVSPVQFYQAWFDDAAGTSQLLGIYDIPASTTTITLAGHKVTDANLAAQYSFASKAEVDALTQAVAAATTAQLYPSLVAGKHIYWNGSTFANSIESESGPTVTVAGNHVVTGSQTVTGTATVGASSVTGNQAVGGSQTVTGAVTAARFNGSAAGLTDLPPQPLPGNPTFAGTVTAHDFVGNGAGLTGIASGTGGVINTGSTTIGADSDADGVGKISFQSGGVERASVEADGQFRVGGQTLSPPFNAKSYGAKGDGTTDDTAAINSAIAALNAAGRGRLYFPAGDYRTTGALTPITAVVIISGDGRGDAASPPTAGVFGTRVYSTSATAVTFTINSSHFRFENLFIQNQAATTPTAGAGIVATNLTNAYQKVDFVNVGVDGFYDDIDVQVGDDWRIEDSAITTPVRYGVRVRNILLADTGGWSITNSTFLSNFSTRPNAIAIKVESCGGAKIANTNILGYKNAVVADQTGGVTSVLLINNCSFENLAGDAISVTGWSLVSVTNCEFGMYDTTTARAIVFDGTANSQIRNVLLRAPNSPSQIGVLLNNTTGIQTSGLHNFGFARALGITGTYSPAADAHATFIAPTFQDGWGDLGAGFAPAGYNLIDGRVVLQGVVQAGTLNSVIFTLPAGFRPSAILIFPATGGGGACQLWVYPDGRVQQIGGTDNGSLSLSGVSFVPYATN